MSKIAVVTGTSYGLGEAIAKKLLADNFKVYGVSHSKPKIVSPQFIWIKADLTNDKELETISGKIKEDKIDLLVNNAGHVFPKKTLDYTDEIFIRIFGLNFQAPIKLTQQLFPRLNGRLIVNTSSDSDRYPDPDLALYGSSKAALNIFFETMAAENKQVKIINILPNYIDTPFLHKFMAGQKFNWAKSMRSEAVAEAIVYIIKHQNKFKSGSRVMVRKKPIKNDVYNPEILWLYTTENKRFRKIS